MTTNPRTKRLVTALVEQHPEFKLIKHKWWYKDDSPPRYCPSCATILTARITPTGYRCARCSAIHTWDEEFCFAPDLTDRAKLADLFDVCDYIGKRKFGTAPIIQYDNVAGAFEAQMAWDICTGYGATRTEALLAAADDALGLELWEEVGRG